MSVLVDVTILSDKRTPQPQATMKTRCIAASYQTPQLKRSEISKELILQGTKSRFFPPSTSLPNTYTHSHCKMLTQLQRSERLVLHTMPSSHHTQAQSSTTKYIPIMSKDTLTFLNCSRRPRHTRRWSEQLTYKSKV